MKKMTSKIKQKNIIKNLTNIDTSLEKKFDKIMLDVSTVEECNLNCPMCYRKKHFKSKLSLEEIKKIGEKYKKKIFLISGGEPTTRNDLDKILLYLNQQNVCFLMSNGIKFADVNYTKKLVEAGLKYVSFSLNGFNDDVMVKTHGKKLLKLKLKALANLKKYDINVLLSVSLAKGVNEGEIKKLFEYYFDNRDFVKELRIRSMAPIGARIHNKKFKTKDILTLICDDMHFNILDIKKEIMFRRYVNKYIFNVFDEMSCKLNFHLKKHEGIWKPVFHNIDLNNFERLNFKKVRLMIVCVRAFGFQTIKNVFLKLFISNNDRTRVWFHSNILKIGLRSWPDLSDFNHIENKKCRTGYYMNGNLISFCRVNIIKEMNLENMVS